MLLRVFTANFDKLGCTPPPQLFIQTDIDDAFTARLWFGTFDLTDLDAPGEIDSDASGGGRGDRSGQADTPSPDNYVLSVYATCDSCTSVLIEVALHLVDGVR